MRGAGGGEDDHNWYGCDPPSPGKNRSVGRKEKVIEGEGEKNLAHGGNRPDAGESAVNQEGDGKQAGANHPALRIEVGPHRLVGQTGQSQGVDKGQRDDPGTGTG